MPKAATVTDILGFVWIAGERPLPMDCVPSVIPAVQEQTVEQITAAGLIVRLRTDKVVMAVVVAAVDMEVTVEPVEQEALVPQLAVGVLAEAVPVRAQYTHSVATVYGTFQAVPDMPEVVGTAVADVQVTAGNMDTLAIMEARAEPVGPVLRDFLELHTRFGSENGV